MVDNSGQLYTIEGISAGLLMIVTAYLVVSSTSVLTPQDVHITDVQLEQLGNDALAMMDTRDAYLDDRSPLQDYVLYDDSTNKSYFAENFTFYCNSTPFGAMDNLRFNSTIHYINNANEQSSYTYYEPAGYDYYRENAVVVSRWIYLEYKPLSDPSPNMDSGEQMVLMEVLLWRG
jgi:hypothetical protein